MRRSSVFALELRRDKQTRRYRGGWSRTRCSHLGGFYSRVDRGAETWQAFVVNTAILPSPRSIRDYCQTHAISRLRLFGSATRGDFDPLRSDVDLLVEYEPGNHPGLDHFRIADELSELFGARVDLNTPAMLGRHLEKVLPEARLLYGKA